MYLIHKALSTEAAKLEALVKNLEIGGSLQAFILGFSAFTTALVYHAEQEDNYISGPLTDYHTPGCSGSGSSEKLQTPHLSQRVTKQSPTSWSWT